MRLLRRFWPWRELVRLEAELATERAYSRRIMEMLEQAQARAVPADQASS